MRNWFEKLLCLVLALALVLPVGAVSARAVDIDEEVTYTITFAAGKQGSFTGTSVTIYPSQGDAVITPVYDESGNIALIRVSNLKYGQRVAYDAAYGGMMDLNEPDKYYVKGVRKSGRDNKELVNANSIPVDCDEEIVVAYGIRGNMVAYTVRYLDLDGQPLADSRTYYGNVGDRPVVAYLYIDGYRPQAYNLIKTLQEDSAQNIFTFVYKEIETTTTGGGQGGPAGQPTQPSIPTEPTTTEPTETAATTAPTEETTAPTETTVATEPTTPVEITQPTEETEYIEVPDDNNEPTVAPTEEPTEEPTEAPSEPATFGQIFRNFWDSLFNTSEEPSELMELDDFQIPLAGILRDAAPAAKVAVSGISAAAGVGGLGLLTFLLVGKRKKDKDKKQSETKDTGETNE